MTCKDCKGEGLVNGKDCPRCEGSGRTTYDRDGDEVPR